MSRTVLGLSVIALIVVVVLIVVVLVLLDMRRDRRKAQAAGRSVVRTRQPSRGEEMRWHDQSEQVDAILFPDGAVSVAELLEREGSQGRGVRLNWSEDDTDPHGLAADGEWPTEVLPRLDLVIPSTSKDVS